VKLKNHIPKLKLEAGTVRWVNLAENYWVRARPEQIIAAAEALR
jgi:hypothetical protein